MIAPDGNSFSPTNPPSFSFEQLREISIQYITNDVLRIIYEYYFNEKFVIKKSSVYVQKRRLITSNIMEYLRSPNVPVGTAIKISVNPQNYLIIHSLTWEEKLFLASKGKENKIFNPDDNDYLHLYFQNLIRKEVDVMMRNMNNNNNNNNSNLEEERVFSIRLETTSKISTFDKWIYRKPLYYHFTSFGTIFGNSCDIIMEFLKTHHNRNDVFIEYSSSSKKNDFNFGPFWLK